MYIIYIYTVIRLYVNNHEHVRSKTKYRLTNLNNVITGKPSENHPKPPVHHRFEQRKRFQWPSRAKNCWSLAIIFRPSRPCQSTWRNNLYHPVKHLEALALQGRDLFQAPSGYRESGHCPRQEALSDYPELHFLHTGGLRGFSCHWLFIVETVVNTWTKIYTATTTKH